ncbi:MAG: S41 family peptidase [Planctomycetota bacterium]
MRKTDKHDRRRTPWTTKALVGILGLAVAGSSLAVASREASNDYTLLDPVIDVLGLVRRYSVEPPSDEDLQAGAIRGLLEALDDPYATYVPPEFNEDFNKELTGEYVGIGAEVVYRDNALEIVTPLDGSPALRAGIRAGDRVTSIAGQSTEGRTADQCIELLKGTPGTDVELVVERGGELVPIVVERGEIQTLSVRGFQRDPETDEWRFLIDADREIAYVRLSRFTPSSYTELRNALRTVGAARGDLGGLILDLRFNGGGVLEGAVQMADLFLDSGTIVSTRGRAYEDSAASARRSGTLPDFPMIVLINGSSASASEVLAGALQDNGRAKILGTRSFGKGSVQTVRPLSGSASGAILKLTEQRYYLPSGRSISRTDDSAEWGVDPSPGFFVSITADETEDLLRIRREQEIIGGDGNIDAMTLDEALDALADPQLDAAVNSIRDRLETGDWITPRAEDVGFDQAAAEALVEARRARERLLRQIQRIDRRVRAIESAATDETIDQGQIVDLWDDEIVVEGGELVVRDADGNIAARLRITGDNLERWLLEAGVAPLDSPSDDSEG